MIPASTLIYTIYVVSEKDPSKGHAGLPGSLGRRASEEGGPRREAPTPTPLVGSLLWRPIPLPPARYVTLQVLSPKEVLHSCAILDDPSLPEPLLGAQERGGAGEVILGHTSRQWLG